MFETLSPENQAMILARMETFPFHQGLGFKVVEAADGSARARIEIGPEHMNAGGLMHGGIIYTLMDVTAYCAAMTVVPPDTNATTHDIHVQVLRPVTRGSVLDISATVRKRGRSIFFIDVEAHVGNKVAALARVAKSLVPLPPGAFSAEGGA